MGKYTLDGCSGDVFDLEIKGFNLQNTIYGLSFTIQEHLEGPWRCTFGVQFKSALGMEAEFRCSRVEVLDAIP